MCLNVRSTWPHRGHIDADMTKGLHLRCPQERRNVSGHMVRALGAREPRQRCRSHSSGRAALPIRVSAVTTIDHEVRPAVIPVRCCGVGAASARHSPSCWTRCVRPEFGAGAAWRSGLRKSALLDFVVERASGFPRRARGRHRVGDGVAFAALHQLCVRWCTASTIFPIRRRMRSASHSGSGSEILRIASWSGSRS